MIYVHAVYLAHYSPLTERRIMMEKQFKDYGILCDWFEDEPTETETQRLYDNSPKSWKEKISIVPGHSMIPHRELNYPDISLVFKHIKMFETIVENGIKSSLILEDDAILEDDFVNKFNFNLSRTPRDWDFIFIGSGCNLRIPREQIEPGKIAYRKSHPASKCTDSYLVSLSAAKKVLETIKPFSFPIDFELNYQMCLHDMSVYWWEPPITVQGSQNGLYTSEIQQ
jgi:GR25 family glycosyltransferase involved in LPS biosynthesis